MSATFTEKHNHYALRKFKTAGLASALIGVSALSFLITNNKPVKASVNNDPNEESNNNALKHEAKQDVKSGTYKQTIEHIHQSKTTVTKLPQTKRDPIKKPVKQKITTVKQSNTHKITTVKQSNTPKTIKPTIRLKQSTKEIHENLVKTNKTLNNNLKIANVPKQAQLKQKSSQEDKDNAGKKPTTVSFNTDTFTIPANYFKNNLHTILATSLFDSSALHVTSDTPLDIDAPDLSTWKQGTTTLKLRATIDSVDYDLSLNPKQTSNTNKAPFWDTVIKDTKPDKDGHYKTHIYDFSAGSTDPYNSNAQNTSTGFDINSSKIGDATSMHLQSGPTYYYNIRPNVQEIACVYKLDDNGSKLTAIDQLSTNGVIEHAMYVTAGTKGYNMPEANMQLDTDLDGDDYVPIYTDGNHGAYIKGNITLWLQPVAGINMSAHKWTDHSKTSTRYSLDKEAGVKVLDNADTAIWYELKGMHINPGQTKMYGFRETLFANGLDPTKQGNLLVNYVDEHNNDLAKGDTHVYDINTRYHTTAKNIPGYHLINYPNNANGIIKAGSTQVIYQYHKNMPKQIGYKVIDDDSNGREISHGILNGMSGEELHVNPVTNINIPNNYVLKNFDTFNYGMVKDDTNPDVIIHVKHKIIGTANNLTENVHTLRDYLLNSVKNNPNITIIHDQDQTKSVQYNDQNGMNNQLAYMQNDYQQQENNILQALKNWDKKAKLTLHYHNDALHLTKTSTYQVIERMPNPDGTYKYGNNQTILNTTITAGKDVAHDLVTNNTTQTSFLGKYTNGVVNVGKTDGYDETVIWGKQPTIDGYTFKPFQDYTTETFSVNNKPVNSVLSVISRDGTIHFDYLVGADYLSAHDSNLTISNLPDSHTWYVDLVPIKQSTNIVYVDDDNHESHVGTQTINGSTDMPQTVELNNFDQNKYELSYSDPEPVQTITGDTINNQVTNYKHYSRDSYQNFTYMFNNIYNKDTHKWTNEASLDQNQPIIIHLREKIIGNKETGNIIDPVNQLKHENTNNNITWIEDPTKIITVNDDNQTAIDQALTNVANDYNQQEQAIKKQLSDYHRELDQYNQNRQAFIDDLKAKGLYDSSMTDPTTVKQSLHLDLNANIVPQINVLDSSVGHLSGQRFVIDTDKAVSQNFIQATYDNLQNSSYRNQTIKKMVITLSNIKKNAHSAGGWININTGVNNGITYHNILGVDLAIQFYNNQNQLINFGDDAYLTIGSLNGYNNKATECAQLLSSGKALNMPQSAVKVHGNNQVYMDNGKVTPESIGLDHSFDSWDNTSNPNRVFGSALLHFNGNTLKLRAFQKDDLNSNDCLTSLHNECNNHAPVFIWSTMLPPLSFDAQAPKTTIHYHTNQIKTDFSRQYTINYVYPNDVQDYYDNHSDQAYIHANRYAGRNLVTNQDSYSNYDINQSFNFNKTMPLNWQQIYGYNIKSDIPNQQIVNNYTSVAFTKNNQDFNGNIQNLANNFNYNVYYTPGQVVGHVKFVDEDTNQLLQNNNVYGYVDQTVDISNIPIPHGYQIAPDSEKPDKFTFHPSDNLHPDQSITIYVIQKTREVTDTPRIIHVIVNNHPKLNSNITFNRTGILNEYTGQTKWSDWNTKDVTGLLQDDTSSFDLDGSTLIDLDDHNLDYQITLNNNPIKSGTLTADNSDLNLDISPDDAHFNSNTHELTYVINLKPAPAVKQQDIIYEDRETHYQLGTDSITGPIGSSQRFTLQHFDGYKDPTNIPNTLTIKSDDNPYVIYLDKIGIFVPHTKPVKSGDTIANYTQDYKGSDVFPDGLDQNDLNRTITRTIYITKNGNTQTIVQNAYFYRDAYYYPVDDEIRYTNWSPAQTFNTVQLDHDGVTPIITGGTLDSNNNITPITVNANDQDIIINVSYKKDDQGITLVWIDNNMSDREIKRINMSLEDFKNNSHPETAILPDFRYTDINHSETYNNYAKDITYVLSDSNGQVLAHGNLTTLNQAKNLLQEHNNGYIITFKTTHTYQTLHANNDKQTTLPPFKSTYRTVHVHLPNGLTYKFRFGVRWKLKDRTQDLVTGMQKALNTDILYEPVSYSNVSDPEYPEITKESVLAMLANYGLTNIKLDNYDIQISGDGSGKAITASSPNQDVNITFLGHHVQTKVELVDKNENIIAFNYLSGRIGQTIKIPYPDLPSNYVAVGLAHYPKTYTFTSDNPEPVIVRVTKVKGNTHNSIPIDPDLNMSNKGMSSAKQKEYNASIFTSSFMAIPKPKQSNKELVNELLKLKKTSI